MSPWIQYNKKHSSLPLKVQVLLQNDDAETSCHLQDYCITHGKSDNECFAHDESDATGSTQWRWRKETVIETLYLPGNNPVQTLSLVFWIWIRRSDKCQGKSGVRATPGRYHRCLKHAQSKAFRPFPFPSHPFLSFSLPLWKAVLCHCRWIAPWQEKLRGILKRIKPSRPYTRAAECRLISLMNVFLPSDTSA